MKKSILGLMLMLLLVGTVTFNIQQVESSEQPATEWSRTYGGTNYEAGQSVVQTIDGGYAVAGLTLSLGAGDSDFWLVKANSTGHMEWNKTYGGPGKEIARSLVQTSDGGYAIAGETWSFGAGGSDYWLVKTYANGTMQWNRTYGGANNDPAYNMIQTDDGGYAIAGRTRSFGAGSEDFYLVRTDSAGNMQWSRTYGGTNRDGADSVVQTSDGGYALAGYTYSFGAGVVDAWLVKTNSTGGEEWNQTYGGTNVDGANSLIQTGDGGYAIIGRTDSFGADSDDFWLIKTNSTGHEQWNQTYGGTSEDIAYSVVQTRDGGYSLAGHTFSFGAGDSDFWLVKANSTGHMEWNKTYGGTRGDSVQSLIQTNDGGYAIAGRTGSFGAGSQDFWLIKLEGEREPTKWAVVIGVDEYWDPEQNVEGPSNSAKDMNETLVEYMSFPSDHIHLLVDEIGVSDDDITKAIVESELEWLQTAAIPEDIVVFYHAGHGYQDTYSGYEYLYAHDLPLRDDELAANISKIKSENLCVILDISYSGGFIKDGQTFWEGFLGLGGVWSDLAGETPSGRLVLTACAENVTIQCGRIWLDRDAAAHSFPRWFGAPEMVFTHYLVQGFRGRADSNDDGKVTVEEAFWYARDEAYWDFGLVREPFGIHTGQTPMIYDGYPEYEGEGELYLGD